MSNCDSKQSQRGCHCALIGVEIPGLAGFCPMLHADFFKPKPYKTTMNRFLLTRLRENEKLKEETMEEEQKSTSPLTSRTTFNDNHGLVVSGSGNVLHVHFGKDGMELEKIEKVEEAEVKEIKEMPELLNTDKAKKVLNKLQSAGYLDESLCPVGMSMPQIAVLAFNASEKIWGETKWKPFEDYWEIKNIKNYYQRALSQRQTNDFMDDIKKALR